MDVLDPMVQGAGSTAYTGATVYVFKVDDPLTLDGFVIPPSETNRQHQYYVKRLYNRYIFTNHKTHPCYLEFIWLRCRTNIPKNMNYTDVSTAVQAIMGEDAPDIRFPFISPTTSPTLHAWFKIVKRTVRLLRPGKPTSVTHRSSRAITSRPITQDTLADDGNYVLLKGSTVLVTRVHGVPMTVADTDYPHHTALGTYLVSILRTRYVSYYNMDSASSVSTNVSTYDLYRPDNLDTQYPTNSHHTYIHPQNNTAFPEPYGPESHLVGITNDYGTGVAAHTLGSASGTQLHTVTP